MKHLDGEGGWYRNPNARCLLCGRPVTLDVRLPEFSPALYECRSCKLASIKRSHAEVEAGLVVDAKDVVAELEAMSDEEYDRECRRLREEKLRSFKFLPPGVNVEDYL